MIQNIYYVPLLLFFLLVLLCTSFPAIKVYPFFTFHPLFGMRVCLCVSIHYMLLSLISNPLLNQHTYCPFCYTYIRVRNFECLLIIQCNWCFCSSLPLLILFMPLLGNMICFKEMKVTSHVPNFHADYH